VTGSGTSSGTGTTDGAPRLATAASDSRLLAAAHRLPLLAAMLLGLFLVGMMGFAPTSALHDLTHDSRHSHAFPCH